jgi:hypothetical protein
MRPGAKLEQQAREHPVASTVGDIAGGVVTAPLVPQVKSVGAAAKLGATLGAAAGLGNSNADVTKGDVRGAALDTSLGALVGGAAGAAGQKIGASIPGASSAAADELKDLAERKAVNALRPKASEVQKLIENGKLGELGDWLLRNNVVEAGDTFKGIATKAEGIKAGAGKALDAALQDLDATGQTIPKSTLADAFMDLATQAEQRGPGAEPVVQKYLAAAQAVMDRPEKELTISQGETWKRAYQDAVNYAKRNRTPLEQGSEEIAGAALRTVEDAADKAAAGTPLADTFRAAKDTYGKAAQSTEMAGGALSRQESRNIASPSDKVAFLEALEQSHNPMLAAVAGIVNNQVRNRAASTTAVVANKISGKLAALSAADQAYLGRVGTVLASAFQRGGQKELNAHLYVLAQTDPKFNELKQKVGDDAR